MAQATQDKKLVIWDVEKESIKYNMQMSAIVADIEWSRDGRVLLRLQNGKEIRLSYVGEVKMLDLETKVVQNVEALQEEVATSVRWNPRRSSVAAIGYSSGRIAFIDIVNKKTRAIEVYCQEPEVEGEPTVPSSMSEILDMQWD